MWRSFLCRLPAAAAKAPLQVLVGNIHHHGGNSTAAPSARTICRRYKATEAEAVPTPPLLCIVLVGFSFHMEPTHHPPPYSGQQHQHKLQWPHTQQPRRIPLPLLLVCLRPAWTSRHHARTLLHYHRPLPLHLLLRFSLPGVRLHRRIAAHTIHCNGEQQQRSLSGDRQQRAADPTRQIFEPVAAAPATDGTEVALATRSSSSRVDHRGDVLTSRPDAFGVVQTTPTDDSFPPPLKWGVFINTRRYQH